MTSKTRTRRAYTEEFKREAVALVTEQGYRITQAARSLDIGANLLGRWKHQFEAQATGVRLGSLAIDHRSFIFQHAMEQQIGITGVLFGECFKALFKGRIIAPGSVPISGHRPMQLQ